MQETSRMRGLVAVTRRVLAILVTILLLAPLPACHPVPFVPGPKDQGPSEPVRELPRPFVIPMNLDFESPYTTHADYWWDSSGGPYSTEFAEVNPPIYWTANWYEGFQCPGTPIWKTGRPEVGLIKREVDPVRVRNGERTLKLFTFHRCHTAGVQQRFSVTPGQTYRLTAYAHTWSSNCSSKPHYPCALDWDCSTCIPGAHELRVGLDPGGGINPYDVSVVWSPPYEIYGVYGEPLAVVATATSGVMTAHLFGVARIPLRHNDDYWDKIIIEEVEVYHYPLVVLGHLSGTPSTRW